MNSTAENIVELTRHCTGCNEYKPFADFYIRKVNIFGKYRCKSCELKSCAAYRAKLSPIVLADRRKKYAAVHKGRHPNYTADNRYKYKDKEKLSKAAFHKANPDVRRNINYKQKFGITLDDVKLMLLNQGNLCANRGCGQELIIGGTRNAKACLDHCHATGKVRALLCTSCNTALGHLENKNKMLGLTEYLQKFGSN